MSKLYKLSIDLYFTEPLDEDNLFRLITYIHGKMKTFYGGKHGKYDGWGIPVGDDTMIDSELANRLIERIEP